MTTPGVTLTPAQMAVVHRILDARGTGARIVIKGYAGTGKSTVLRLLADLLPDAAFVAPTNKAARRLRELGVPQATTLHVRFFRVTSFIFYKGQQLALAQAQPQMRADIAQLNPAASTAEIEELVDALIALLGTTPIYAAAELSHPPALVVVDEAGMVPASDVEKMRQAAPEATFVFIGDGFQLAPVAPGEADADWFHDAEADIELTEIHRTALGSPITALATAIRSVGVPCWPFLVPVGFLPTLPWSAFVAAGGQVITWKNETRQCAAAAWRRAAGRTSGLPMVDDVLLVRRSAGGTGFTKGTVAAVADCDGFTFLMRTEAGDELRGYLAPALLVPGPKAPAEYKAWTADDRDALAQWHELRSDVQVQRAKLQEQLTHAALDLQTALDGLTLAKGAKAQRAQRARLVALQELYGSIAEELKALPVAVDAIYACAVTAHAAQGSEWPLVAVINERGGRTDKEPTEAQRRWLYTAVTRAKSQLFILPGGAADTWLTDGGCWAPVVTHG